jgi:hypothetical protein
MNVDIKELMGKTILDINEYDKDGYRIIKITFTDGSNIAIYDNSTEVVVDYYPTGKK